MPYKYFADSKMNRISFKRTIIQLIELTFFTQATYINRIRKNVNNVDNSVYNLHDKAF